MSIKNMKITEIKNRVLPILKQHNVNKAGIFGSVARGETKKGSDIDILIQLNKKISLFEFVRIKLELEKVLKNKVDLVEYKTIKPQLKETILSEEVAIL